MDDKSQRDATKKGVFPKNLSRRRSSNDLHADDSDSSFVKQLKEKMDTLTKDQAIESDDVPKKGTRTPDDLSIDSSFCTSRSRSPSVSVSPMRGSRRRSSAAMKSDLSSNDESNRKEKELGEASSKRNKKLAHELRN